MSKILVIDDDDQVRTMLGIVLKRAGHEVHSACDGEEGIDKLKASHFDLVLTDLVMPKKEGLELIKELHLAQPEVKIIAISGGSRQASPELFLKCAEKMGADRIFTKPVRREVLLQAIDELLPSHA